MIYRAQKKNSDDYVFGIGIDGNFLIERICLSRDGHTIRLQDDKQYEYKAIYHHIDPTTLAIHFPDMVDGNRNKIFAALSENGKGGDICTTTNGVKHLLIYKDFKIIGINTDFFGNFKGTLHSNINLNFVKNAEYKVIGIQE